MSCSKVKDTCGELHYATCIDYEGTLGNNTKITDDCVTIEETTEDLYAITDEIIADNDTSDLGELCLTYPLEDGTIKPKAVFLTHEAKICELKTRLDSLNDLKDLDITSWDIDFGCLSDACDNPITTLGEALQAMATQICANQS